MATEPITPAAPTAPSTPASAVTSIAGAAPPVVAATPETPAAKPDQKLGSAYAKLAREQKIAREEREALKRERQAFDQAQAEYKAYQEARASAKRYPLKWAEANGLTYQDFVEAQLNDGQPTPNLEVKQVRDELESFKRQQEEARKRAVEEHKRQIAAEEAYVITQFDGECAKFIDANAEKYELTKLYGQHALVSQVIKDHWNALEAQGLEPKLLSMEDAAEAVEAHLEESAEKYRTSKKFTAKAQPQDPSAPTGKSNEQPSRSITNQLSGSSVPLSRPEYVPQDDREKRALAAYKAASGQ